MFKFLGSKGSNFVASVTERKIVGVKLEISSMMEPQKQLKSVLTLYKDTVCNIGEMVLLKQYLRLLEELIFILVSI